MQQAEPKGTNFLFPTETQNQSPSTNQVKTIVRSGEARQSSQVGGDYYFHLRAARKNFTRRLL